VESTYRISEFIFVHSETAVTAERCVHLIGRFCFWSRTVILCGINALKPVILILFVVFIIEFQPLCGTESRLPKRFEKGDHV
jgi:hypothetical protein